MTMKRFFRIFAAVALVCSTLVACEEKFVEYDPAPQETTAQVYFSSEAATSFNLLEVETVEIPVMRAVTAGALDVAITAIVDEAHQGLFNIPSSVSFADGEATTTLTITFDPANLEFDTSYPVSLQIAADKITDYGKDLLNLVLDYPAPYELVGTGLFREDIMTTFYSVENVEYEAEIYTNFINPGYVYVKNVYTSLYPYNDPGDYVTEDHYLAINVSDPNEVIIPRQKIGLNWGYGDVEIATTVPGTFKDGVITFPAKGLLICMPEYDDGFYYANVNGMFRVVMPGVELTDYSLALTYSGVRADVNNDVRPVVDAVFGADVAEIMYAVVPGNIQYDGDAIAEVVAGMFDESIVSATVAAVDQVDDEEELLQMELVGAESVEAGIYTMVAIPLNADGEAEVADLTSVAFYVNAMSEVAEAMDFQFATMTMNQLFAMFDEEGNFPESSTMAWFAMGSNISTWKQVVAGMKSVQPLLDKGITLEQIVLANGSDWDLGYINTDGYDYNYFEGLDPETAYIVINYVEDLYGNKGVVAAVHTTAPAEEETVAVDKATLKTNLTKVQGVTNLLK